MSCFHPTLCKNVCVYLMNAAISQSKLPVWHTVAVKECLSVLNFMLEFPQFNIFLRQPFECSEMEIIDFYMLF